LHLSCSIAQHRCKKRLIGNFLRQNGVDRASIDQSLERHQIEEVLIAGFRGFVHINLVFFRIKPAPHLYADSDKEHVDPPVMGRHLHQIS